MRVTKTHKITSPLNTLNHNVTKLQNSATHDGFVTPCVVSATIDIVHARHTPNVVYDVVIVKIVAVVVVVVVVVVVFVVAGTVGAGNP